MNDIPLSTQINQAVAEVKSNNDIEILKKEHEYVYRNYKQLIEDGMTAINSLSTLCRDEVDSPKFYDSLSKLINSVTNANKELFNQTKEMYFLTDSENQEKEEKQSSHIENANNVLIVNGSMNDILELINKKHE